MRSKKKKAKHYYVIRCSHNGTYADETLEDAVGKNTCGSGTCLMSGERDLEWDFPHLRQAVTAMKALSKYRHLDGLTMEYIRDY